MVNTSPSNAGTEGSIPPLGAKDLTCLSAKKNPKKKQDVNNRSNIVTNSIKTLKMAHIMDFPGGPVVKNPPANVGDTGSMSGLRRSHTPLSN